MAKDDYFVLVCKFLCYLYDCLKNGKRPNVNLLKHNTKLFQITEDYWNYVLVRIARAGYAEGIITLDDVDNAPDMAILDADRLQITPEGIQFMHDNSSASKAIQILKELKDLPFSVASLFGI